MGLSVTLVETSLVSCGLKVVYKCLPLPFFKHRMDVEGYSL